MRKKFVDYYQILRVSYVAEREEIKRAYHRLMNQYRSDPKKVAMLKEAWGVLGDRVEREKYDRLPEIRNKRRLHSRSKRTSGSDKVMAVPKTQIISSPSIEKTRIIPDAGVDDTDKTVIHRIDIPLLRIDVLAPDGSKVSYSFQQKRVTIGRSTDRDIVLPDEERYVSRKHAHIEIQDAEFYLVDTSTNGTRLNGRKIKKNQRCKLSGGDVIEIEGWRLEVHFK